jgi:aminopeptidase-like protein
VPETIGSIAYLSRNEELIPTMKGGLFLEMLGREHPHALQLSYQGNTGVDRCFNRVMEERDPASWTGPFRTIIGNDERQFNGPGVRVPMLSLSRVLPQSDPGWPYLGYHSSYDTPDRISVRCLEESRDMVLAMVDALERDGLETKSNSFGNGHMPLESKADDDLVPVNLFKGEVFCSRYGLHIDWATNPEGSRAFFDIMARIDGTQSVAEIASACGISPDATRQVIGVLRQHNLIYELRG